MNKGVVRTIDSLGRIVIPKEYRKTIGIHDLDRLELSLKGDKIEIKKCDQEDLFLKKMNLYFGSFHNLYPNKVFFANKDKVYCFHKKTSEKNPISFSKLEGVCYQTKAICLFGKTYQNYFLVPLYEFSTFLGVIIIVQDYEELSNIELVYKFIKN